MNWVPRTDDPSYEELQDEAGRILAAYGPNPYGMMGQNWKRAWVFDVDTTESVGMLVFAPMQKKEEIHTAIEKAVREHQAFKAAKKP